MSADFDASEKGYCNDMQDGHKDVTVSIDLAKVKDSNLLINILWWIVVIKFLVLLSIGICIVIYCAYHILRVGDIFRGVF